MVSSTRWRGRAIRDTAATAGRPIRARLSGPRAVAVDAAGNVYVADTGNNQVRRIDPLGTITTVDTGNALSGPRGVAVDRAGNVYIADTGNHLVRRVSPGAPVTTIAGNGTCCYSGDGALALDAQLNQPWGVSVDANGNVYVADPANNAVRMLAPVSAGITVSAVTNAASNLAGAIAPGELVVLYGSGLGGRADGAVQRRRRRRCCTQRRDRWGGRAVRARRRDRSRWWCRARARPRRRWQWRRRRRRPECSRWTARAAGRLRRSIRTGRAMGRPAPASAGSVLSLLRRRGQTLPAGVDGKLATAFEPQPWPRLRRRSAEWRRRSAPRAEPGADRGRNAGERRGPRRAVRRGARGDYVYGRSARASLALRWWCGSRQSSGFQRTDVETRSEPLGLVLPRPSTGRHGGSPGARLAGDHIRRLLEAAAGGGQLHGAERVIPGQDQDHVGGVQRILSGIT